MLKNPYSEEYEAYYADNKKYRCGKNYYHTRNSIIYYRQRQL